MKFNPDFTQCDAYLRVLNPGKCLCLLWLGFAGLLRAQDPAYHSFTVDQGLPSNQIFYLHHEPGGRIWVGTDQGLASFNGRSFKTYPSPSTSSKAISPVVQDKNGTIWCGNFNGQIFYLEHDSLKELKHGFNSAGLISKISIDKSTNTLYANTMVGVLAYDIDHKKARLIPSPDRQSVVNLVMDNQGEGIVFSSVHLYKIKGNNLTEIRIPKKDFLSRGLVMQKMFPFVKDHDLCFYNSFANAVYGIKGDTVEKISEGIYGHKNDGGINFVTQVNNVLYANYSRGMHWFSDNNPGREIFRNFNISNSVFDEEGGLWVSTLNKGLLYVPEINTQAAAFENYEPNPEIYSLFPFQNQLYLGQSKGRVSVYSTADGTVKPAYDAKDRDPVTVMGSDPENGWLYIGAGQLYRWNPENNASEKQEGISIKDLTFSHQTLFISDPGGCHAFFNGSPVISLPFDVEKKYYPSSMFFKNIQEINNTRSLSHEFVDATNELWSCQSSDLVYVKNRKTHVVKNNNGSPVLGSWLASYGAMVICATNHGGVLFIENHRVIKTLDKRTGLISNSVKKVRVFGDLLLIISNAGVSVFNLRTGSMNHFTQSDGILSKEIYDACIFNGYLFTATVNGLFKTNIERNYFNPIAPRLYVSLATINGKKWQKMGGELEYNENNLSFFLDAIAFKANGQLRVEYQLLQDGQGQWQSLVREQDELRFNSLSPGNYALQIRSFNEDGVQSKVLQVAAFVILAPVWLRWWFIMGLLLLLALLFYSLYRYRLNKQKTENRLHIEKALVEKELQNSQLSSLKVQMNPHFMFNALNSIQEFILTNEKRLANQYLGKFSDLMRMTLDMSQEEKVLLSDEIKVLNLYLELEELRFGGDFKRLITIHSDINADEIHIPAMLIQPYVENALKHGLLHRKGEKRLDIFFHLKQGENVLVCVIEDNGIGRSKSEELKNFRQKNHKSFATGATKKRLELLNMGRKNAISVKYTDLATPGGEGAGTIVEIEIPFV